MISTLSGAWQVALFDNYLIRFLLGEEVFFLPPGSIDSTHVVRLKRTVLFLFLPRYGLVGPADCVQSYATRWS